MQLGRQNRLSWGDGVAALCKGRDLREKWSLGEISSVMATNHTQMCGLANRGVLRIPDPENTDRLAKK